MGKKWPAPKKGKKPKKIITHNEPGGPHTPGAKAKKKSRTSGRNRRGM